MTLEYWSILIVGISFCYIYYSRVINGIVYLDHLVYIMFGIMFYWLFPIYIFENKFFTNVHDALYNSISLQNKKTYLFFVSIIIVSLLLGDWISRRLSYTFSFKNMYYSRKVLDVFFYILVFLGCYAAYFMWDYFFTGYETSGKWPHERGMFNSVCIALTTLNVINSITNVKYNNYYISIKRKFFLLAFNKYFILAFIFNLLNLSTGNRGYMITFFMSLLLIATEVGNGINIKKLFLIFIFITFLSSFVAIVRSGIGESYLYRSESHIGNIVYEPINVGVTLLHHLKDLSYGYFEIPVVLISKLIGIIPSAIFPGKFGLMISPADIGKTVVRFLATTHSYVELLINFGLIGTILLFFFLGIGFNWLKSKKHYTPIYIAASANIPFFFFRSFYDATVKHIFEFSILLPLLILLISFIQRKYRR